MASEKDKGNSELFKQYERIIGIIGVFIGFLMGLYGFVQAWKTSPTTFTWIIAIAGSIMLLLSLVWVAFGWKTVEGRYPDIHGTPYSRKEALYSPKAQRFARFFCLYLALFFWGLDME